MERNERERYKIKSKGINNFRKSDFLNFKMKIDQKDHCVLLISC